MQGSRCKPARRAGEEEIAQFGNVFAAFAKRRNDKRHDGQPKIQILAETAFRHFRLQIAIRRGQHADIDANRLARTDALERFLLQHAEQFGLQAEVDFRNFIQKQRAAVGRFEASDALRVGAR